MTRALRQPNYVAGGGMRIDYLITQEGQVRLGLPGGNALYACAGAALWSDVVGLWARIGENYPEKWLSRLPQDRLALEGLIRVPGWHEHRTFFAYLPDGSRDDTNPGQHFARLGLPLPAELQGYIHSTPGQDRVDVYDSLALRPGDWPASYRGVSAVHLAPISIRTHLQVSAFLRRAEVDLIAVDPGERYMVPAMESEIRQLVNQVDAFLPSEQEIQSLFGADVDLWEAAERLAQWGAPVVVIKCGPRGVLIYQRKGGRRAHLPAYHDPGDSRSVDTTGAGDAFCGGFLVGLRRSDDPIQAGLYGIVSASFAIETIGVLSLFHSDPQSAQRRLEERLPLDSS